MQMFGIGDCCCWWAVVVVMGLAVVFVFPLVVATVVMQAFSSRVLNSICDAAIVSSSRILLILLTFRTPKNL